MKFISFGGSFVVGGSILFSSNPGNPLIAGMGVLFLITGTVCGVMGLLQKGKNRE